MMPNRARIAAGVVALGLMLWWWQRPSLAPLSTPPAAPESVLRASDTAAPDRTAEASPETPLEELRFETVLLPRNGIGADPPSLQLGIAHVPADQAQAFRRQQAFDSANQTGMGQGAGPRRLADLAQVQQWLQPTGAAQVDGRVLVGPLALPAADRYELRARGRDPLYYYAASFTADEAPATIEPVIAAGLRITREHLAGVNVRVGLRRVQSGPDAALWQDLISRESPQLLQAFSEQPLNIDTHPLLLPLAPGPLDVIFWVDGIEADQQRLQLQAGRISELKLDLATQSVAREQSVDLQLELVASDNGQPVAGIDVLWIGERGEINRYTDGAGRVEFRQLDRRQQQRFLLRSELSDEGLPEWPELQPLEISLAAVNDDEQGARRVHRRVEIARLKWLVAELNTSQLAKPQTQLRPYPIYVLQREHEGHWSDAASDVFMNLPEGVAASVREPGRYRLALVLTPWRIAYSEPAEFGPDTLALQHVALQPDSPRRSEVQVLRDGAPVGSMKLQVRGPSTGLPPLAMQTDPQGRLLLDAVSVPTIWVGSPSGDELAVDLSSSSAALELSAGR